MKPTAFLIHTARGLIVRRARAYRHGRRRLAAPADCRGEPTPTDNPLLELDNVVVTPHGICFTDECMRRLAESAFRAAIDMAAGRQPPYIVNPEALARRP